MEIELMVLLALATAFLAGLGVYTSTHRSRTGTKIVSAPAISLFGHCIIDNRNNCLDVDC